MGISTRQVTITTTATALVDATNVSEQVVLHSSSGACFIGNSDVTTSSGYRMDNGDKLTIDNHENGIWGICTSGTVTMMVLVISK
jgi:uncharacterized protein (DUF779 family)